jgi:pectin methylesterase-like acyl-CoA thioesterase
VIGMPSRIAALIALTASIAVAPSACAALPTADRSTVQVVVSGDGRGDFSTIQQAIDHAPAEGNGRLVIAIRPGVYRERIVIPQDRPRVTLLGLGKDPASVTITYNMSAVLAGGTFLSSTVDAEGSDFEASNLTIENSFGAGSQAVALMVHSDRAVLRHCRLIGWQDTLYAASGRQYFFDCYIQGAVDFIFGNARAVFDHCEIHSAGAGYVTAQSRTSTDEDTGFVFDHCDLTGQKTEKKIFLGRPWRAYSRVVFLHTMMGAQIDPAGWSEWHPGETNFLQTSYYAEYDSSGPGGSPSHRDSHGKILAASEATQFDPKVFLASPGGWDPANSGK